MYSSFIIFSSDECSRCPVRDIFTVKPVENGHSQKDQNLGFKTNYRLMQVKSIAECSKGEHSAILLTFIKLPFVIKILVLSIFEWPLKTGFTVLALIFPEAQTQIENILRVKL